MIPLTMMTRWSGCTLASAAAASKTSSPPFADSTSTFLSFFEQQPLKQPLLNFRINPISPRSSTHHNSVRPLFLDLFANLKLKFTTTPENWKLEVGFGFGIVACKGSLALVIMEVQEFKRENLGKKSWERERERRKREQCVWHEYGDLWIFTRRRTEYWWWGWKPKMWAWLLYYSFFSFGIYWDKMEVVWRGFLVQI